MNEKNLEYLKKLLYHLGFGDKLNYVMESAINRGKEKFSIGLTNSVRPLGAIDDNQPRNLVNYQLNFSKGKENETYYLNDVDVTLHKPNINLPVFQKFSVEHDHRITAVQAYKLLSGLSFEKDVFIRNPQNTDAEAEKTPMWFRLNLQVTDQYGNHPLRKMTPEYGYDLEAALDKYPLKFKNAAEKQEGMKTLRSGNYLYANMKIGNGLAGVMVAANPQMKTVDIYNTVLRPLRDSDIWPEKAAAKNTVVQEPEEDLDEAEFIEVDEVPEQQAGKKIGR